MKEYKVGERTVIEVEGAYCEICFFGNLISACTKPKELPPCCSFERSDHKDVIFVEKEK